MTVPFAKVTDTKRPPGSPVIRGCTAMLTLSPGLRGFDFQPAFARTPGAVISTFQVSTPPLAFGTSISIHECGLTQPNPLMVPVSVTVFWRSNPVIEWCGYAGTAIQSPSRKAQALNSRFIMALYNSDQGTFRFVLVLGGWSLT